MRRRARESSVASLTDEELAQRVRAGDRSVVGELMARYEPELLRRAKAHLGGRLLRKVGASDVAQDTFAAVFASIDRFEDRGPGSFRAWLLEIFEHKAADPRRRFLEAQKRDLRREVTGDASGTREDREPPSPAPSPSAEAMRNESRARLSAALARLSADDATVIRLVHEDGLAFEEIGRRMERSTVAARKLYSRAVRRLARVLEETASRSGRGE